MDPFRIGLLVVAVSASAMMLSAALPVIIKTLLEIVPNVLALVVVFLVLRAMIGKLLS